VEYLFTEPSGIVIPQELRTAILVAARDVRRVSVGPVVVLLDGSSPDSAFDEHLAHITAQQVRQSDLLAISKVDSADPGLVDELEASLREMAPGKPIYRLSVRSGQGLPELADVVL
jgi:G3E family GTPase